MKKKCGGVYASLSERGEYYSQRPPTPLLDTINYPIHMKNLSTKVGTCLSCNNTRGKKTLWSWLCYNLDVLLMQELKQLADELRSDVIFSVSRTGGHLGSSLGVVELTVALHYVFNTPQDKILWDVGHQVGCQSSSLVLLLLFLGDDTSTHTCSKYQNLVCD